MALALEGANQVWQRVTTALFANGTSPEATAAFKSLKQWLATQKGNPRLQFVPFSAEQAVAATGYTPVVGAALVYAVYMKGRRTTGTTASYVSLHDAADNASVQDAFHVSRFNAAGQESITIRPNGARLTTDLTIAAATTVGGPTESAAADGADGFVILGQ